MSNQLFDVSGTVFKREETTKDLIVKFKGDNGAYITPNTAHNWIAKIANQSGYLGNYPVTIDRNQIKISSEKFDDLPADTYYLEIWEVWDVNGDTQRTIYPSPGEFVQFTIEKNITDSKGKVTKEISIDKLVSEIAEKATKNITIDKVIMTNSNAQPKVEKHATEDGVTYTLTLPKGDPGKDAKQPQILVQAKQLPPDQPASATVSANTDNTAFNLVLGIPQGCRGEQGEQGVPGVPGPAGKSAEVAKTFDSIKEMEDSKGKGLSEGDFVVIASDVNDPDNAKIYTWTGKEFKFLVDMSGANGIKGEQGEPGPASTFNVGTVKTLSSDAEPTVEVTGKDGNYTINYGIPQGKTGKVGPAPVVKAGTTSILSPGAQPTIDIAGGNGVYTINLGIPQGKTGAPGATPVFNSGNVIQLSASQQPTVELVKKDDAYYFNFGIPQGKQGDTPVRGVDYWTEDDKKEILNETKKYVEDAILNGKW